MLLNATDGNWLETKKRKSTPKPYDKKGYSMKYSIIMDDETECTVSELARHLVSGTLLDEVSLATHIRKKIRMSLDKSSVEVHGRKYTVRRAI